MRRIWRHKWLLMAATMVVFLSIGAAALAATAGTDAADDEIAACTGEDCGFGEGAFLAAAGIDIEALEECGVGPAVKKVLQEKREHWRILQAKLLQELREDMTPGDQALYDELVATAKDQREVLREAREELQETLKGLRDLAKKYLVEADTAD